MPETTDPKDSGDRTPQQSPPTTTKDPTYCNKDLTQPKINIFKRYHLESEEANHRLGEHIHNIYSLQRTCMQNTPRSLHFYFLRSISNSSGKTSWHHTPKKLTFLITFIRALHVSHLDFHSNLLTGPFLALSSP